MRTISAFLLTFILLLLLTSGFLFVTGDTPNVARQSEPLVRAAETSDQIVENPTRVNADPIGLDAPVVNPASTDIEVLNAALLEGAVRYPTSARLGEDGTMLLFGHSTNLPIVYNKVYKTFNNIQNLKKGDIVSVHGADTEYRYRVTGVELADATKDIVELPQEGRHLKLLTCNNFAKKEDRFIVSADFVGVFVHTAAT